MGSINNTLKTQTNIHTLSVSLSLTWVGQAYRPDLSVEAHPPPQLHEGDVVAGSVPSVGDEGLHVVDMAGWVASEP